MNKHLILCLIFILGACLPTTQLERGSMSSPPTNTYTVSALNLSFDYPADWLVGAVTNPVVNSVEGSPQAVIAQTAMVKRDELALMQPIFEAILRSIGSTDTRSSTGS